MSIAMWTTERLSDFRRSEFSREIELRMQRDLMALEGLSTQLPEMLGARVIVEKGYAIDAVCNGKLTRTHYDTDIILATPYINEKELLVEAMQEVLERSTDMGWVATPQKRRSWIKFHEKDKRQWDDGITNTIRDEELAHQMDVHLVYCPAPFAYEDIVKFYPKPGVEYDKPIMASYIGDTFGRNYEFTVPTVDDMLATKLRLIRSFDTFYGNALRESDYYDFGQLLSHPDFRPNEFIRLLEDYYINQGVPPEECRFVIEKELEAVIHLVPRQLFASVSDKGYSTY